MNLTFTLFHSSEEESKQRPPADEEEIMEREKEIKLFVLKIVAEMQRTSEELAVSDMQH